MTRWQLFILLGAAFLLGVIAVQYAIPVPSAVAQDSDTPQLPSEEAQPVTPTLTANDDVTEPPVLDSQGGRLVCRLFLVDLTSSAEVDTSDRTTEVGQWVGQQVDSGLSLHGVDFEVGQKPTGYPQGYLNVCLYPT